MALTWNAEYKVGPAAAWGSTQDYVDLATFQSALDGSTPGTGPCTVKVRGAFSTAASIYFADFAGDMAESTRLIIKADSGYETDGKHDTTAGGSGGGYKAYNTSRWQFNDAYAAFVEVRGVESYNVVATSEGFVGSNGTPSAMTAWVFNCLICVAGSNTYYGMSDIGGYSFYLGGCIIVDVFHQYTQGIRVTNGGTFEMCNCTVVGNGYGTSTYANIRVDSGETLTLYNCAIGRSYAHQSSVDRNVTGTVNENGSLFYDDAEWDASTDCTDWTDGTGDFTIADTDSELYYTQNPGSARPSWFTNNVSADIAGTTWDNTNRSIGAFEYASGATTHNLSANAACTTTTSGIDISITDKLSAAASCTTTTGAIDLSITDKLSANAACSTTTSAIDLTIPSVSLTFNLIADGAGIGFSQDILTVGKSYRYSINIISVTSGGIQLKYGSTVIATYTTSGTKTGEFTTDSATFSIVSSEACDVEFDDIGVTQQIVTSTSSIDLQIPSVVTLSANVVCTTTTSGIDLPVAAALSANAACTTSTSAINLETGVTLAANAACTTTTSAIDLPVAVATAANAACTTATGAIDISITDKLSANAVCSTTTSAIDLDTTVTRQLSANAACTTTTGGVDLSITDKLAVNASCTTTTSGIDLAVAVPLAVNAACTTATSSIDLLSGTSISANAACTTSTSDIDISITTKLNANSACSTTTSDIDLTVSVKLAANAACTTSTSDVDLDITDSLAANAACSTTTSAIDLDILTGISLAANAACSTTTSAIDISIETKLSAAAVCSTTTSDIDLAVAVPLVVNASCSTSTSAIDLETATTLAANAACTTTTSAIDVLITDKLSANAVCSTTTSGIDLGVTVGLSVNAVCATTTSDTVHLVIREYGLRLYFTWTSKQPSASFSSKQPTITITRPS